MVWEIDGKKRRRDGIRVAAVRSTVVAARHRWRDVATAQQLAAERESDDDTGAAGIVAKQRWRLWWMVVVRIEQWRGDACELVMLTAVSETGATPAG